MADTSSNVLGPAVTATDYRKQFVELKTSPMDYASGEHSILVSTFPFLPKGVTFAPGTIGYYPMGVCQSFTYNESQQGTYVPEVGSERKVAVASPGLGSGSIARLQFRGNSLLAALYRPVFAFLEQTKTFTANADGSTFENKIYGTSTLNWLKGLVAKNLDIGTIADVNSNIANIVIAAGGMQTLLTRVPFGLISIKRDGHQNVIAIDYFEQCSMRGDQSGLQAGQPQVIEALNFEFEHRRGLLSVGPYAIAG